MPIPNLNPFIFNPSHLPVLSKEFSWQAPSNIALIKYWGKHGIQLPKNASISFTLSKAKTLTHLKIVEKCKPQEQVSFTLFFEGKEMPQFRPKIEQFFASITKYCPYLLHYKFVIETQNTFPHGSGIASSASGLAALACCVMELEKEIKQANNETSSSVFVQNKTSFLARLGSGSAARSTAGPLMMWGAHPMQKHSNNLYGVTPDFDIHAAFNNYRDCILLVDTAEKKVSSTLGHNLMNNHPFAKSRFVQAEEHMSTLLEVLQTGNLQEFIRIVELEALTLHAMMMTSNPYFILMQPPTLSIINAIWEYRNKTHIPLCFTLDAGANVHLLYPDENQMEVMDFVKSSLLKFCFESKYIEDKVGIGAQKTLL